MRKRHSSRSAVSCIVLLCLSLGMALPAAYAQPENTTPQPLPMGQDWTNTELITLDDNWDNVPGIMGYRGDGLTGSTDTDPQTLLMDGTGTPVDVNANKTDPNTFTTGGLAEFHIADPVVAFQGSGTADAPFLLIALDTTGYSNIRITYNLRDIDGSADNSVQQVALHYRVGNSGDFTNLPGGYVPDATTGPSQATLVTPIDVTLPSDANNQPLVQVRMMTTNAGGNDEWVGVDDISVTGTAGDSAPFVASTDPADGAIDVAVDANLTVSFSENVDVDAGWFDITCSTSGSHTAAVSGGPLSFVLDPDVDFSEGESCTATIYAAAVHDQDLIDPPDTMDADYIWSFTVIVGDLAPYVAYTTPLDGEIGVPVYDNLTVAFSEEVSVDPGWFDITCSASGGHTAAYAGGPTTFTLDPDPDFSPGETCQATVYAAAIHDLDANDPPDGMDADYTWSFTAFPVGPCAELFFSEYVEGSSNNKAVEIVNPTGAAIDLAGYDVQIFFNGSGSPGQTIALAGTVAAGDVWLLCHSSAAFAASCDQTISSLTFNGDDAVVLRHSTLTVDSIGQVGYDPGYEWGSGMLSTQDNTLRRKPHVNLGDAVRDDGFSAALAAEWDATVIDTFDGLGSHTFLCADGAPYVVGSIPDDLGTQVPLDSILTVNFNERVDLSVDAFGLECTASGAHALSVWGGPSSYTLDPDGTFAGCEECVLTVYAAWVTDQDADDPPNAMEADYSTRFAPACACASIPQIQGFGATSSPCRNQYVTMSGCVTGVAGAGFYMQDPAGDGDASSSDGIYVYMYSSWTNGEGIEVGYSATASNFQVQEYYGATELYKGSGTLTKGAACTVPAPVEVPQIMALGDHDVNEYETTEFMRVQMDLDGHVQGPTKRFTSRFPAGDPEIGFIYTPLVGSLPNSPRLFEEDYAGTGSLNYLSGATNKDLPDLDWGDTFTATDLAGIMAYQYSKWQLVVDELLEQSLTVVDDPDPLDTEAPFSAEEFGICTFNVENLFDYIDDGDGDMGDWTPPDDVTYQAMLEKRARAIVENLQKCPILGIQEMEGKDQVWDDLEAWIEAVAGPGTDFEWDYYESQDERDITVGVFYDTARVGLLSSTQRQGCTPYDYGVSYAYAVGPRVIPNPCGAGAYPVYDRPPYVAQLQVLNGPEVTLIVNHFKSMGGGTAETRLRREVQAQHNAELAWEYSGPTPNLAIVGDLNDYIGSAPIQILNNALTQDGQPLVNVHLAHVPKADQYTYIFNGESEVLDYVFLSAVLGDLLLGASPMHIDADYPDVAPLDSDNCAGGVCPFGAPLDTSSIHASDHDPMFVRFGGVCDPVHDTGFTWDPLQPLVDETVTFTGSAAGTEPIDYLWDFGDGGGGGGAVVQHAYAVPGDYLVTLTASNACGWEIVQQTVAVDPGEMHVHALTIAHRMQGPTQLIWATVRIRDHLGRNVPGATVSVQWRLPDGSLQSRQAVTNSLGLARPWVLSSQAGWYRVCVTDVTKTDWVYDPGQNVRTCRWYNLVP